MPDLKSSTVLILDDEPDVLEMAQDILETEVGKLVCVATYEQAREALERGGVDAAVLDLMGVRGYELIQAYGQKLPCIALTAHAVNVEALRRCIQLGAVAYVPKNEMGDLPQYLRISLSAPPSLSLWHLWLHPRLDPMKLRLHLGAQLERLTAEDFEDLLPGASAHREICNVVEHADGILELQHCDPPLNLYGAGGILFLRRLLARLREDPLCRAVVFSSGLPPGLPPEAVDMLCRTALLRRLPRATAKKVARAILRVVKPRLRRSIFFGAGMPLDTTLDPALLTAVLEFGKEVFLDIFRFPKPWVTVVEGGAVAGSFEQMLCAHYVVADRNAAFWLPEFRLGFTPPAAIPLLINRVGAQRAFTIAAEARMISWREAARLGIVDRIVAVGRAKREGVATARRLADRQAVAGLELARALTGFDVAEALDRSFRRWSELIETPIARQHVRTFFEERGRKIER